MSFFGFDQPNDLEEEKRKFLEGGLAAAEKEDVPTYTWGEASYDGLGDALEERGDELNDETFGGSGAVGKDFDFSNTALPDDERVQAPPQPPPVREEVNRFSDNRSLDYDRSGQAQAQSGASSRPVHSLEAIWDDKNPFSVLPRTNGASRPSEPNLHSSGHGHGVGQSHRSYSPFDSPALTQQTAIAAPTREMSALHIGHSSTHSGVRTLEEIEAEMRQAFAAQRNQNISPSQAYVQSQVQHRGTPQPRHLPPSVPTPPPRMHPHAQSPRFHQQQQQHQIHLLQQQQQRQLLELQEERKRQQRIQLLELQEQLRLEELERQRQLRAQQQAQLQQAQYLQHQRQNSGRITPSLAELQNRRYGQSSPANNQIGIGQPDVPFQHSIQYLPRDIQLQQRLLAEMAQAEFLSSMQGGNGGVHGQYAGGDLEENKDNREQLTAEAMRKIMEAEKMEEKRRRKLEKIRHMSRYNDLMTQSDKDFITRIQVSQLVTQDPYTDDFYAQVYGAIMRSRLGVNAPDAVLKFGSGGGVGLGVAQVKGNSRRPSAMQRMEAQVERIVNNARLREKEKSSLNSLQGALGKTAGRSYKAAPRQLLQVDSNGAASSPTLSHATPHSHISKADAVATTKEGANAAAEAANFGRQALGNTEDTIRKEPLTHRETLVKLERVYDIILDLEQMRREQPDAEDVEGIHIWESQFEEHVKKLWDALQVMVPLDTSNPHPFISLLTPVKGKRMLPRVTRYLSTEQSLTLLTLLVACFSQLDVVVKSWVLDQLQDTPERREVEAQTQAFLGSVMQSILPIGATASLRLVSGILGVFLERNDIGAVAKTRPGIALLTMFLSRVEVIKQDIANGNESPDMPTESDMEQWQLMFDHLFALLTPHLVYLFPSVRQSLVNNLSPLEIPDMDVSDQPVWQFLAALGLNATLEQQQVLVASLRERVLENVASAAKGWGIPDEETRKTRLANVNIFLHALGLDSSQIAL